MSDYKMSDVRKMNKSQSWGTPQKYVDLVKLFFNGDISLDPCSNEHSIVNANIEYSLPKDGLLESWNYPTIYLNPPYGSDKNRGTTIKNWLIKASDAHNKWQSEIIALIPVATNTSHWKQGIFGKASSICFLYDTRLKFLENGENNGSGAPMACCFVYWGNNYSRFYDIFIDYGAVVNITNLKNVTIGLSNKL